MLTVEERVAGYLLDVLRQYDSLQTLASLESTTLNSCYSGWIVDDSQLGTAIKAVLTDVYDG